MAIGDFESDAEIHLSALRAAQEIVISPVNVAKVGLMLFGRRRLENVRDLERWLAKLTIYVAEMVDYRDVLEAHARFGRGNHRAKLNLGDCFAYALAKQLDAPLLYKGGGFARTDIRSALQPT